MTPYIRSLLELGYEVNFRSGLLRKGVYITIYSQGGRQTAQAFVQNKEIHDCGCCANVLDHIDDAIRKEMK